MCLGVLSARKLVEASFNEIKIWTILMIAKLMCLMGSQARLKKQKIRLH